MPDKIRKRVLISVAAGGIIYLALTIYADSDQVLSSFLNFNWILLPLLLLLSLGNYLSRFFKWQYYLKLIDVRLKFIDSLSIFMSGLIMSVTPGKFGELLKSYLVKQVNSTPISRTAPVILAERATDFLSLTILALAGAYYFDYGKDAVLIISAAILTFILILSNRNISEKMLSVLGMIGFLKKHIIKIRNAYESSFILLGLKPLMLMTSVSILSWGFECLGYYLILTNFSMTVEMIWAFFSYSFSTIVGAVSMFPGGIGVTEGSLTLMQVNKGFTASDALASTFIVRAVTLWFAVIVGAASVLLYQKRFGKIIIELNSNQAENTGKI